MYAKEIKRSLSPSVSKGFYLGCEDIGATHRYIFYPGNERFSIGKNITVVPLLHLMDELRSIN